MGFFGDLGNEMMDIKQAHSSEVRNLEVYCLNETCGDPVPGYGGRVAYTKRRMSFDGFDIWHDGKFRCPVCSAKRKFKWDPIFGGIQEL